MIIFSVQKIDGSSIRNDLKETRLETKRWGEVQERDIK